MLSQKEIGIVYETVLGAPRMEEEVKISLKVSRRDVLLLSQIIGRGVMEEQAKGIIAINMFDALKNLESDLLNQGKFSSEFMDRWRSLTISKAGG